jgi:hypothetical protein
MAVTRKAKHTVYPIYWQLILFLSVPDVSLDFPKSLLCYLWQRREKASIPETQDISRKEDSEKQQQQRESKKEVGSCMFLEKGFRTGNGLLVVTLQTN